MSALWDYARLKRAQEQKDFSGFYCLFGEETYLIEQALTDLTEALLEGSLRDFNYDSFYSGAEMGQVRDIIETLPMMALRRVVVIKEAQNLKAKDLEILLSILENPVESTCLILVASKIDQRLKFFKEFQKRGVLVKFERPFENQVPNWIRFIAQKHGKEITPEAIDLIHQWVGSSLLDIDGEIRKVSQYMGGRVSIEVSDVESVVSKVRVNSVFALAHAIGSHDRATALLCLAQLLDHGENSVGVLAMVSRHIRILMMVKDAVREGLNSNQVGARVGVPGFFVRDYIDQSRQWTEARLKEAHHALLATDRALKSSPVSTHIWLENFVIRTCNP